MSTTFKANVQDATINNNLTVDTNTLSVDATNNRVGIGTASPEVRFHIIGTATDSIQQVAHTTGHGGMYLTVAGTNSAFTNIGVSLNGGSWTARATDAGILGYSASAWRWYANSGLTNGNTYTPTERMTLTSAGNLTVDTDTLVVDAANNRVGIVTASPSEALHVTGNVRFSGALMPNNLPGSSGQVLQSNGAGTAPTWVTNSAGMSIGGTVTSGTAGSILFVNSGPVLAQDNNNLFWDDSNNRLGVRSNTPDSPIHVIGSTTDSTQHWASAAGTGGVYLTTDGANSGFISIGSSLTSSNWTARAVNAGIYGYSTSAWRWYTNSGLTNGNTYTPTQRMALDVAGDLSITGRTVTTDADLTTSGLSITSTFTKNDSNVRTFQVLNISPTMNFGGSNAGTTVDILKVNNTLTSTTGLTLNLAKFATAGTNRAIMDISGHLSINAAGAIAPTVPLDIFRGSGSAGVIGKFTGVTAGTNTVEITANSSTLEMGTAAGPFSFIGSKSGSNHPLYVRINGTEVARFNSSAFFGVGVDPFRRLTIQGSEEFLATFRSTGTKAKHTFDTTGGSFNSYVDMGVDTSISANTGGFGSYIFTGTDSGHATFGTGDGTTARPLYLKVDGDAVAKFDTDRRMKLANAMALGPLTTGNRNSLASLQNGEIIWNTTNTKTEVYTGAAGWIAVAMENTAAPSVMSFGAISSANTVTTEYIWPGYGFAASTTEIGIIIPTPGLISRLFIKAGTGPTGDSIVYTVRKNGTDQTLTATLAAAATTANDTTHGFTVTSGDEITIKSVPGASLTAGVANLRISVEMTIV